jgi:hypothetical protein
MARLASGCTHDFMKTAALTRRATEQQSEPFVLSYSIGTSRTDEPDLRGPGFTFEETLHFDRGWHRWLSTMASNGDRSHYGRP